MIIFSPDEYIPMRPQGDLAAPNGIIHVILRDRLYNEPFIREQVSVCHRTGTKNAPVTSHPERLNCTSCHVQGEVKPAKKSASKGKKK